MMRRRDERLDRIEEALARIDRSIDRIEVATIVREPSVGPAAEAYEGLRRQIVAATGERSAHLALLAQLAETVRRGDTADLGILVEDWMRRAGLERREDPTDDRYFDVLGGAAGDGAAGDGAAGDPARVVRPAYVDGATGRPVLMGQAEHVAADGTEQAGED